eukprot:scaffold4054_cov95-Isochrysis_galbana.AAC.3
MAALASGYTSTTSKGSASHSLPSPHAPPVNIPPPVGTRGAWIATRRASGVTSAAAAAGVRAADICGTHAPATGSDQMVKTTGWST